MCEFCPFFIIYTGNHQIWFIRKSSVSATNQCSTKFLRICATCVRVMVIYSYAPSPGAKLTQSVGPLRGRAAATPRTPTPDTTTTLLGKHEASGWFTPALCELCLFVVGCCRFVWIIAPVWFSAMCGFIITTQ